MVERFRGRGGFRERRRRHDRNVGGEVDLEVRQHQDGEIVPALNISDLRCAMYGSGLRSSNIGTLVQFTVNFHNLPEGSVVNFIMENDRDQTRRDLDYEIIDGEYRVFYILFSANSYHILFTVNNEHCLSVRILGLENINFFVDVRTTVERLIHMLMEGGFPDRPRPPVNLANGIQEIANVIQNDDGRRDQDIPGIADIMDQGAEANEDRGGMELGNNGGRDAPGNP